MAPHIVAASRTEVRCANGVRIEPHCCLDDCPRPDIVCVPDIATSPAMAAPLDTEVADWLRRCHAQGCAVASVCSGTLLLADAGLLDGLEATTHWGAAGPLRARHPEVTVREARTLVFAGEGERLITAGGGSAWHDLALYLVARFIGTEEAVRIAKLYLLDWHIDGQLPFASPALLRPAEDSVVAASQAWIAEHLTSADPVSGMVRYSGLAERSFKRCFARALGMAPIDYVHTLRPEAAKTLLETSELVVDAIAEAIGYADGSFFRRLFRRRVGITPAAYRRRFGALRRTVAAPASQRSAVR